MKPVTIDNMERNFLRSVAFEGAIFRIQSLVPELAALARAAGKKRSSRDGVVPVSTKSGNGGDC